MNIAAFPFLAAATFVLNTTSLAKSPGATTTTSSLHSRSLEPVIVQPDRLPQLIGQTRPVYPAALKESKMSGEVLIEFVVDESGQPRDVQCLRETTPGFADAAVAAVQQWRFYPATKDGRPVACRLTIPIIFALQN